MCVFTVCVCVHLYLNFVRCFFFGSSSSKHRILQQKYPVANTRAHIHLAIRFDIKFKRFQKFTIFRLSIALSHSSIRVPPSIWCVLYTAIFACSFGYIYRHQSVVYMVPLFGTCSGRR